jgi:hypothetical protein
VKLNTSFEDLCAGLPDEFAQYFHAVRRLRFTETPEYSRYRKMFRKLFLNLGFTFDYEYDWAFKSAKRSPLTAKQDQSDFLSDRAKRLPPPRMSHAQKHSSSKQDSTDHSNAPHFSTAVHPSNLSRPSKIQTEADAIRYQIPRRRESDLDSDSSDAAPRGKYVHWAKPEVPRPPPARRERIERIERRGQTEVEIQRKMLLPKDDSSSGEDLSTRISRPRAPIKRRARKASDDSEYDDFTEFHKRSTEVLTATIKPPPRRVETEVEVPTDKFRLQRSGREAQKSPPALVSTRSGARKTLGAGGRQTLRPRAQIPDWMNDKVRVTKRQ